MRRDKRELTERNAQIMALRREGKTLREIAELMAISVVRVHAIVQREMRHVPRETKADPRITQNVQ